MHNRRCVSPKPNKPAGQCPLMCSEGTIGNVKQAVFSCKCDETGCSWRNSEPGLICISPKDSLYHINYMVTIYA